MNYLKNRLKERTTLDGVVMMAAALLIIVLPMSLIAGCLFGYGMYTALLEG